MEKTRNELQCGIGAEAGIPEEPLLTHLKLSHTKIRTIFFNTLSCPAIVMTSLGDILNSVKDPDLWEARSHVQMPLSISGLGR